MPIPPPIPSVLDRMFAHRQIDSTSGCWLWTGATVSSKAYPYGVIRIDYRLEKVHRLAAIFFLGLSPWSSLKVCHSCDNPRCWNPAHLFVGTQNDNVQDMRRKGRKATGAQAGKTHLTADDVAEIRRLRKARVTCAVIGSKFGITRQAVSRIARGVRWPSM